MKDSASLDQSAVASAASTDRTSRPGCVTALAIVGIIVAIGLLYEVFYTFAPAFISQFPATRDSITRFTWYTWFAVAVDLLRSVTLFVACLGLWRMKNWSRLLLLIWVIVNVSVSLIILVVGYANGTPAVGAARNLPLGLIFAAVILLWFIPRRKLFT